MFFLLFTARRVCTDNRVFRIPSVLGWMLSKVMITIPQLKNRLEFSQNVLESWRFTIRSVYRGSFVEKFKPIGKHSRPNEIWFGVILAHQKRTTWELYAAHSGSISQWPFSFGLNFVIGHNLSNKEFWNSNLNTESVNNSYIVPCATPHKWRMKLLPEDGKNMEYREFFF